MPRETIHLDHAPNKKKNACTAHSYLKYLLFTFSLQLCVPVLYHKKNPFFPCDMKGKNCSQIRTETFDTSLTAISVHHFLPCTYQSSNQHSRCLIFLSHFLSLSSLRWMPSLRSISRASKQTWCSSSSRTLGSSAGSQSSSSSPCSLEILTWAEPSTPQHRVPVLNKKNKKAILIVTIH